jgi:hypothetical protein
VGADLHSIADGDGGSLWLAGQGSSQDGGPVIVPGFDLAPGAQASCAAWNAGFLGSAFDPSPIEPMGFVAGQDMVATPSGLAAYYTLYAPDSTRALGIRLVGYGLAPRDATTGRFAPTSELLWSADRPGYGSSAIPIGGMVYVHGCRSSGPFTEDCFVARALPGDLASPAGYTYFTGDHWSQNPDDAASVVQGVGDVSVRPDPTGRPRFLMTYVPPLGNTIVARSAIAPEGPWSAPVTLGACALDPALAGAFCGGGEQHPELLGAAGRLVVSYDARTFDGDAAVAAGPTATWPRIVTVEVPAGL